MKQKRYQPIYLSLLAYLSLSVYAHSFEPAQRPLVENFGAKPNIMLLVDNSRSMSTRDVQTDPNQKCDTLPRPASCRVRMGVTIDVIQEILETNRNRAYFGLSVIGAQGGIGTGAIAFDTGIKWNTTYEPNRTSKEIPHIIAFPIADIGDNQTNEYNKLISIIEGIAPTINITPLAAPLYEISRYFRGLSYKINPRFPSYYDSNGVPLGAPKGIIDGMEYCSNDYLDWQNGKANCVPAYLSNTPPPTYFLPETLKNKKHSSPIQYRCQKNHVVVLTDGAPAYDYGFSFDDDQDALQNKRNVSNLGNTTIIPRFPFWDQMAATQTYTYSNLNHETLFNDVARFIWDIDMRDRLRDINQNDKANKPWGNDPSTKQNIQLHTIGFQVNNTILKNSVRHSDGVYATANSPASIHSAFDTILSKILAGSGGRVAAERYQKDGVTVTNTYSSRFNSADWTSVVFVQQQDTSKNDGKPSITWHTNNTILFNDRASDTLEESFGDLHVNSGIANNSQKTQFTTLRSGNSVIALTASGGVTQDHIDWVTGVSYSPKNATLRTRSRPLGDVIDSPLTLNTNDFAYNVSSTQRKSQRWTDYINLKKQSGREYLLFGTNDGIYNALNPTTGERLYGFVPSFFFDRIATVASRNYVHTYSINGTQSISDVRSDQDKLETVSVTGLGAGGKGYFAVKLFDSDGNNALTPLWEISNTKFGYGNLGYTYSNIFSVSLVKDQEHHYVFGNGYGSANGVASLFIADKNGNFVKEIIVDNQGNNGLSTPELVLLSNGQLVKAYAGDLKGNLWKFDFSDPDNPTFYKLFKTLNDRPITVKPVYQMLPDRTEMLLFGSGKYLENQDVLYPEATKLHHMYGIQDVISRNPDIPNNEPQILIDDLLEQKMLEKVTIDNQEYITVTTNELKKEHRGWYMPLQVGENPVDGGAGERVIYDALTSSFFVLFNTIEFYQNDDPCLATSSMRSKSMILDIKTGSGPTDQNFVDTNRDGKVDKNDTGVAGTQYQDGLGQPLGFYAAPGSANSDLTYSTLKPINELPPEGADPEVTCISDSTSGSTGDGNIVSGVLPPCDPPVSKEPFRIRWQQRI